VADRNDESLVAELRDLGGRLAVPPAPDLRAAVRERLTQPAPARRWRPAAARRWRPAAARRWRPAAVWRWRPATGPLRRSVRRWRAWLVAAFAVLAVVAVVPPARAAVVDAVDGLLRFAGVAVRPGPEPGGPPPTPSPPTPSLSTPSQPTPSPPTPSQLPSSQLPSIRSTALDEARRAARFPVRVPSELGSPDDVTLADPTPDGAPRVVTLLYRGGTVRLDQFDGRLEPVFYKTGNPEWTQLGGRPALWFAAPHPVSYIDRTGVEQLATARLAGPCLVWESGGVTYRLEGIAGIAEAVRIAGSLT
jgi:hypothetical protein